MILVHYKDNWADEFDIMGFALLTEKEWEKMKSEVTDDKVFELYFGTNEAVGYESKDDFLERFWSRPVTKQEAAVLKKMFRGIGRGYGFWPFNWIY